MGRIVTTLPNGQFEVRFDVEDEFFDESYTYSYSKITRLKKNASVRIGTKLSIYWPHENRYYTAVITKELPRKRENFLVCYCHNTVEREWIDLHRHKFRILVPSSSFNDCLTQFRDSSVTHVSDYSVGTGSHYRPTNLPKEVDCVSVSNDANNTSRFNTPTRENFVVSVSETALVANDFSSNNTLANKVPIDSHETNSSCDIHENRQPQHLISSHNDPVSQIGRIASLDVSIGEIREESRYLQSEACTSTIRLNDTNDLKRACAFETNSTANISYDTFKQEQKLNSETLPQLDQEENNFVSDNVKSSMDVWSTTANEIHDSPKLMNCAIKRIVTENEEHGRCSPDESIIQHADLKGHADPVDTESIDHAVRSNDLSDPHLILGTTDSSKVSDNDAESDNIENDNSEVMLIDVGTRVEVYWPDDDCYYAGVVTKRRLPKNGKEIKKPFFLIYDDNESEWIDFSRHKFRIIENPNYLCQVKQEDSSPQKDENQLNRQQFQEKALMQQQAVKLESSSLKLYSSTEKSNDQSHAQKVSASVVLSTCPVDFSKDNSKLDKITVNTFQQSDFNHDDTVCGFNAPDSHFKYTSNVNKTSPLSEAELQVDDNHDSLAQEENIKNNESTTELRPQHHEVESHKLSAKEDIFSIVELIPRRRTSRTAHPTKFFANEISESILRNGSDHTRASEAHVVNSNASASESTQIVVSNSAGAHTRTASPICPDSQREGRKAALDALVRKKKSGKIDEKIDISTTIDNNNAGDDDSVSSVKSLQNKLVEDLINLQVGVKVAVWCNHTKAFLDGIIVKETSKKTRFIVNFDSTNRSDSIDFEKTEFKIIKRKRGRPKKATGTHKQLDIIGSHRPSQEVISKQEDAKQGKEKNLCKKVEKPNIEIGTKVAVPG